jgi:DNA repair exonuclease SbcCD nuclease subunit
MRTWYHPESNSFTKSNEDLSESGLDLIDDSSKVAILGDLHFGARSDSTLILEFLDRFLDEFFVAIKRMGIRTIIQLGDLFDRRKYIDFYTLESFRTSFEARLEKYGIHAFVIVGNHDAYFRNSLKINSPNLVCRSKNIHVIDKPTSIEINKQLIDLIPWICEDNQELLEKMLMRPSSRYAFGHFEFEGFMMYPGVPCTHGIKIDRFISYKKVYSGHFHTRGSRENVTYLGTPIDLTWSDCGDPKYFMTLDLETGQEEWYENTTAIVHHRVTLANFDSLKGKLEKCRIKVDLPKYFNDQQVAEFLELVSEQKPSLVEVEPREELDAEREDFEVPASKMDPLLVVHEELKFRKSPDGSIPMATELYAEAISKDRA